MKNALMFFSNTLTVKWNALLRLSILVMVDFAVPSLIQMLSLVVLEAFLISIRLTGEFMVHFINTLHIITS